MDRQRDHGQIQNNSTTSRNGGTGSGNQMFFEDASPSMSNNMRPPEAIMSAGMKPVLNYSIGTGEEFALEFMRERINSWQHFAPNSSGHPSTATSHMGINTTIGSSHVRSEGGSEVSVAASVEKIHAKDLDKKNCFVNEETGDCSSTQSLPVTSAKSDTNHRVRAYASSGASDTSSKVKFLCSFGGKVLPRPSDRKLRYVGGETHIIHIRKNISWHELLQKACLIYKETYAIKYQLPGEDLDALVSVSSDEDLQNMMEECSSLEVTGPHKPRMFLFSTIDLEFAQFSLVNMEASSEVHFIIAVNGLDLAPTKVVTELKSTSVNGLDELFSLKVDRHFYNSETTVERKANTLQPSLPTSSFSHESTSLSGQPALIDDQLNTLSSNAVVSHIDKKDNHHSSVPLQTCNIYPPSAVVHGNKDSEDALKVAALKRDPSLQRVNVAEQGQCVEKETSGFEGKLTRDNSSSKISDTESYHGTSPSCTDSILDHSYVQESYSATSAARSGVTSVHTRSNGIFQEPIKVSASPKAVTEGREQASREQNESHTLSGVINHQIEDDYADHSLEQPVLPQRFHSEWIPREQAGPKRLSKSDDSFGTQFLMAHLQSNLSYPIAEANDLGDGNSKAEYPMSSVESPLMKSENVDDGMRDTFKEQNAIDADGHNSKHQKAGFKGMMPALDHEKDKGKDGQRAAVDHPEASNMISKNKINELAASRSNFPQDKTTGNSHGNQATSQQQLHSSTRNAPLDATQETASVEVEAAGQGDILIDINDRFPRDFLADIFSMARISQGLPGYSPLGGNGTNLSLNMENHEPGHWSFFRNLAQDDFVRKDDSCIDVSHHGFSSHVDDKFSLGASDSLPQNDSHLISDEVNRDHTNGSDGSSNLNLHSDSNNSQTEGNDSQQFDGIVNKHLEKSEYEDRTGTGIQNAGSFDPSLRNIDLSTLQG